MAATLSNELLLEILSDVANSPGRVELSEISRLSPELLARVLKLASRTTQDREKLGFYKRSLSTLTTHLNLLTTRLTTTETGLQAQAMEYAREAEKNREEVDAFRTLSKVWEGRWKEERREKEELEAGLCAEQNTSSLNAGAVREEASIIVHRSPIKPNRGRRRSLSTTSSSSSDSRRDPSRRLLIVTGSTRAGMKLSSKQVIADLSRELERVRRDGESLLRERDDQIDRLQHERQLRKTELKDVYLSFDTLLGLGGAVELSANAAPPTDDTTPRHKAVRTKSGRSARLKAEIQEMEQEVARLLLRKMDPEEQLLLSSSLQILETDIAQLQAELREGLHERDTLRNRLFGSTNHPGISSVAPAAAPADARRTAELEAANEQLIVQLTASTRESAALQTQLDETETTFEGIAQRVRETMVKKQDDLRDAASRISLLEERLAVNENRS